MNELKRIDSLLKQLSFLKKENDELLKLINSISTENLEDKNSLLKEIHSNNKRLNSTINYTLDERLKLM